MFICVVLIDNENNTKTNSEVYTSEVGGGGGVGLISACCILKLNHSKIPTAETKGQFTIHCIINRSQ